MSRKKLLLHQRSWRHPMIKKIYFLALLLLGYNHGHSQEQFTISNLTKVPQVSYLNPALVPSHLRYFVGIPLLSGIHLNSNSQGFQLKDIGLSNWRDRKLDYIMAAEQVSMQNTYRFGGRVDLLYGGIANKSGVFTINFTERAIGESTLPLDFFQRLADEESEDLIPGQLYDVSSVFLQALHFKELGVGFATQKRKGINWGLRLKFLLGHEAIFSDNQGLMLREDGQGNLNTDGSFSFRSAGFRHFSEDETLFRIFSTKNAGVALDAGFHYQYNKRWEFFGSVHDLGGITWRKSLNLREVTSTFGDLISEIDETFESLVNVVPEMTRSFRTALPAQLSGGLRYRLKNEHSLSALASVRMYHTGTDVGFSLGYQIPVTAYLDWTANYAVYNKSFANIGTGFSLQAGRLQLYFASDNILSMFSATGADNFQFQTGVNLVWKKPDKKQRPMANRETIQPEDQIVAAFSEPEKAQLEDSYFTLSSQFVSAVEGKEINAIYVDIYRYSDSGEKQLIHTSRYPSDEFEVTLYRLHTLHEMTVKAYGFEPLVYQFVPESSGLDREFKLSADTASSDK